MKILVVDGQGGGIGKSIIEALRAQNVNAKIFACGTNAVAAGNMQKAGADHSATGENAIVCNARTADVITGPIGIVMSDALLGEITAKMAQALASSKAVRVLVPLNKCNTFIVGVSGATLSQNIAEAAEKIKSICSTQE